MDDDLAVKLSEIAGRYGYTAEILPGIRSVGVQGDYRAYLPVAVLMGPHDWTVIAKVSTEITNTLPIGRVSYDITPLGRSKPDMAQPE